VDELFGEVRGVEAITAAWDTGHVPDDLCRRAPSQDDHSASATVRAALHAAIGIMQAFQV
jgi:hypothetical protein